MNVKYSIVMLLILLMLSVSAIVLLSGVSFALYKKYLVQRLDPTGMLFFSEQFVAEMSECEHVVIFLGSSRAAQWTPPTLTGICYINAGINGQTSAQVALRTKQSLEKISPDVVVIQVGTNDIKSVSLFADKKEQIFNSFKKNMSLIVQTCKDNNTAVIVTTIFPVPRVPFYRKPFWRESSEKALVEFNQYLEQLSDQNNVFLFDSYTLLKDQDSNQLNKQYKKDFLHINEKGYTKLNTELTLLINKIINNK